jgi:hypothetical protein
MKNTKKKTTTTKRDDTITKFCIYIHYTVMQLHLLGICFLVVTNLSTYCKENMCLRKDNTLQKKTYTQQP